MTMKMKSQRNQQLARSVVADAQQVLLLALDKRVPLLRNAVVWNILGLNYTYQITTDNREH
jgi:hypothetical protein